MDSIFTDKKIIISGGTGSWGRELTRQLLEFSPKKIIIFSRGEISQVDMQRQFNNPLLEFVIGDVRDAKAVDMVFCHGINYVFHLAALKHVPICENQPWEAIQTNIIGTMNLINASILHGVKKFIDVSTDKAVSPINTYGLTKGMGERLSIQANCMTKNTEFICIRGGNVLGTNGSVIPYIINQIKTKNEVTITNIKMTRFFLTLPQAIHLLFQATAKGIGGETYVMNMPSFYIKDLVEIIIDYYGDKSTTVKEIGAREGEKIHEVLISEHEVPRTWFVNNDYYCIMPQLNTGRLYYHDWMQEDYVYQDALLSEAFTYQKIVLKEPLTSETNLKGKDYLIKLLQEGGWLR